MTTEMPVLAPEDLIFESENSVIYRAKRPGDGTPLVVKTTRTEYPSYDDLARLKFEYEILQQLRLPGVIGVHGFEQVGGRPAILMEDFGAHDLSAYQNQKVSLDLFFDVATKIIRALGEIHQQHIIHKDINPRNILMNPATGEVKIIDFNIASELSREKQRLDTSCSIEGSLEYISPEQTGRMNRAVDYRADYYSLGVTFFELLTGQLPFEADDTMGFVHCHLSMHPRDPRGINAELPLALTRVVLKLMEKNPEDRYQSTYGLEKDLDKCKKAWKKGAADAAFDLGAEDRSESFSIPDKLYGRQGEIAALTDAFERTTRGDSQLLLVSGKSGVGKSSLINEIHAAVLNQNGYFISGKFDQFERNVPFFGIASAVRSLVQKIMTAPPEILTTWQKALVEAVGANGPLMTTIVPELAALIGPQAPLGEISAEETRHRLHRAFNAFLNECAKKEHPLVVFLDDLQWSDASSLELLKSCSDEKIPHLMMIGAFRDDVADEQLPILRMIAVEEDEADEAKRISLEALSRDAVNEMVADTLHTDLESCKELADLVFDKTEGNAFFANELLLALYQKGHIDFDHDTSGWTWHLEDIKKQAVSDNVVTLLVDRLKSLPTDTLEALMLAACIGHRFDLKTLASVSDKSMVELTAALLEPVQMGILLPLGKNYRLFDASGEGIPENVDIAYAFSHDRLQEAVYSLIPEAEKVHRHHRIGRLLQDASGDEAEGQKLFDIVNHLNIGRLDITDPAERLALAMLNDRAGAKAKRSSAFAVAAAYFEAGLSALSDDMETSSTNFRFNLTFALADSLQISGDPERAFEVCETLFALAGDKVELGRSHILKACILEHQGNLDDTIETIREGLRLLDIELKRAPEEIDQQIGKSIGRMQSYLAEHNIAELADLPEMTNVDKRLAMEMLYRVVPAAIQTYPPLFVLAELMMFDLAVTYGTTAYSSKNFADCGIIQGGMLGNYDAAYKFGEVAFEVLEKYEAEHMRSAVAMVFATFISHWGAHYQAAQEYFDIAHVSALETGDVLHMVYNMAFRTHLLFYYGETLKMCEIDVDETAAQLSRCNAVGQFPVTKMVQWGIKKLTNHDDAAAAKAFGMEDDAFVAYIEGCKNTAYIGLMGMMQSIVAYVHGNPEEVIKWVGYTKPHVTGLASRFPVADYHLIHGLALADGYAVADAAEKETILASLEEIERQLNGYADAVPENFGHKYYLVAAEVARAKGACLETVVELYDKALAAIGTGELLHMNAIIHERVGGFWLSRRQPFIAEAYIVEAHRLYVQWGARRKVASLENEYEAWFKVPVRADSIPRQRTTTALGGGNLDTESILKATLAVANTIEIDKLLVNLTNTMMENAGADKCILMVKYDTVDAPVIEATGQVGKSVEVLQSQSVEESDALCPEIVRYVTLSKSTVVLNHARREGDFRNTAYVKSKNVKSILCLPIVNLDKLRAVVYLENNLTTYAFTPSRVAVLKAIAAPAAVTLENAFMYTHLDDLVKKRTAELEAAQTEIAENAHMAGMSEIATTVLHNVGNVLNSLKTAGYVTFETAKHSKLDRLLKANSMLRAKMNDIDAFITKDPKGKKLLNYYLELGDVLDGEKKTIIENTQQILNSTESISEIINAQQSYAYADASFAETLSIVEIIENALTLNASSYDRHTISVQRRFEQVPALRLHKSKTLHVILNLLKNAKEAMLANDKDNRKVVIDVRVEDNELKVEIADSGHGIEEVNRAKLFTFGFTTKENGHGSGLHSSANYMTEMGGRIWVESEGKGKGATFGIAFPLS